MYSALQCTLHTALQGKQLLKSSILCVKYVLQTKLMYSALQCTLHTTLQGKQLLKSSIGQRLSVAGVTLELSQCRPGHARLFSHTQTSLLWHNLKRTWCEHQGCSRKQREGVRLCVCVCLCILYVMYCMSSESAGDAHWLCFWKKHAPLLVSSRNKPRGCIGRGEWNFKV